MRRVRSKTVFLIVIAVAFLFLARSLSPAPQSLDVPGIQNQPISRALTGFDLQSPVGIFRRLLAINQEKRPTVGADNLEKLEKIADPFPTKPAAIPKSPVTIFRHLLVLNHEQQE